MPKMNAAVESEFETTNQFLAIFMGTYYLALEVHVNWPDLRLAHEEDNLPSYTVTTEPQIIL